MACSHKNWLVPLCVSARRGIKTLVLLVEVYLTWTPARALGLCGGWGLSLVTPFLHPLTLWFPEAAGLQTPYLTHTLFCSYLLFRLSWV